MSKEWTEEQKADRFRAEIRERFEAENASWRAEEARDIERLKTEQPDYFAKQYSGFGQITDSFLWEIYTGTVIEISAETGVRIILPGRFSVGVDCIGMFEHTSVAWSRISVNAEIIDGVARVVLSLFFIDYWTDEREAAWRHEHPEQSWKSWEGVVSGAALVVDENTFERIIERVNQPRQPTAAMLSLFRKCTVPKVS